MPATKTKETQGALNGKQKVAILCMVLGREAASKITERLTPDEVEGISYEIARMENVNSTISEAVLHEYLETARAAESIAVGGVDYAKEILEQAFGSQRASFMFKRLQSQLNEGSGLHRLRKVDPQQLGGMLRNEHPQTIALILAHLDPPQTASVLKEIGPEVGKSVIYRMASMEKVSPEMLELIERALGPETELNLNQGLSTAGGPQTVAAVLNLTPPSMEKELLDGLLTEDPDLCEEVKNLMFVFEDIIALDSRAMARVLREIDSKDLALALKVASDDLKAHVLGAMSKRAVEALEEEMEFLGPVRLRDVETAQVMIVTKVRQLEEAGEIVINAGGEDEVIQ
ncbi:MAG: flagellar motor switch protein FliG [Gemmatimonadota bacterium]